MTLGYYARMSLDSEWTMFLRAFREAVAQIAPEYFAPRVAGGGDVWRERVYAYELYHQLRVAFEPTGLVMHGEMDKASHPVIPKA